MCFPPPSLWEGGRGKISNTRAVNSVCYGNRDTSTCLLTHHCCLSVLTQSLTAPQRKMQRSDGNTNQVSLKIFISGILSFILTRKGCSCEKDCSIDEAYKICIKNTTSLSAITISRKMIKELKWFFFFKQTKLVTVISLQ